MDSTEAELAALQSGNHLKKEDQIKHSSLKQGVVLQDEKLR